MFYLTPPFPILRSLPAIAPVAGNGRDRLSNGTQLAWLVDFTRQQIWVWLGEDLPLVYAGTDILPSLGILPELTVDAVMAMTQR